MPDLSRLWESVLIKADIPDVRIHDLRRTYAPLQVSDEAWLEMTGQLFGHTQISSTQRNANLINSPLRARVNAVGGMPKPGRRVTARSPCLVLRSSPLLHNMLKGAAPNSEESETGPVLGEYQPYGDLNCSQHANCSGLVKFLSSTLLHIQFNLPKSADLMLCGRNVIRSFQVTSGLVNSLGREQFSICRCEESRWRPAGIHL